MEKMHRKQIFRAFFWFGLVSSCHTWHNSCSLEFDVQCEWLNESFLEATSSTQHIQFFSACFWFILGSFFNFIEVNDNVINNYFFLSVTQLSQFSVVVVVWAPQIAHNIFCGMILLLERNVCGNRLENISNLRWRWLEQSEQKKIWIRSRGEWFSPN